VKHAAFLDHIRRRFPDATTTVTEFASGAVDIAIRRGGRLVVVQHADGLGYGVSLVPQGDEGPGGHDKTFGSMSEACDEVDALLL
jgi:hypothetical protein